MTKTTATTRGDEHLADPWYHLVHWFRREMVPAGLWSSVVPVSDYRFTRNPCKWPWGISVEAVCDDVGPPVRGPWLFLYFEADWVLLQEGRLRDWQEVKRRRERYFGGDPASGVIRRFWLGEPDVCLQVRKAVWGLRPLWHWFK